MWNVEFSDTKHSSPEPSAGAVGLPRTKNTAHSHFPASLSSFQKGRSSSKLSHQMATHSSVLQNDTQTICDKTVLLLCGLPGAGKSTLARQFRDEHHPVSSFAFIEYDDIQDSLLNDTEEQDDILQAWRSSRTSALQRLSEHLADSTTTLLLLDDNFHLRSMRKQIFQSCQAHVTNNTKNISIHFGLIWMDTPVDVCLERNAQRQRRLPDRIIQNMKHKFEAPGGFAWEQSVLRLDGTAPLLTHLEQLRNFTASKQLTLVEQPVDPTLEQARLAAARKETQASIAHQIDQYLRCCVQIVARNHRQCAGAANQCRKLLLSQLRHQHELVVMDIEQAFLDRMRIECCHVDWDIFRPTLHRDLLTKQTELSGSGCME